MKKIFLLSIALMLFSHVNAQLKRSTVNQPNLPPMSLVKPTSVMAEARMAEPGSVVKKAPRRDSAPSVYYRRPAGAFPAIVNVVDGSHAGVFYAPYITVTPYVNYTFNGYINGVAENYDFWWGVKYYNSDSESNESATVTGQNLVWKWSIESDNEAPVFYAINGTDTLSWQSRGYQVNGDSIVAVYPSYIFSAPSVNGLWEGCELLKSSKTFCYGGRNGDQPYPMGCFPGALPYGGNNDGWWFGKNAGVKDGSGKTYRIDGIAQAFEKPTVPYMLKQVVVRCSHLTVTGNVPMTCKVYKLDEIPTYDESTSVTLPDEPGELIAKGKANVNSQTYEQTGGLVFFTLYGEEDGITYNLAPTIDCPILVVVDGYNEPEMANLKDFSALISTDYHVDEGFGELAYIKFGEMDQEGNIDYVWKGLNNFFGGDYSEMKTGFTIFITTENQFLTFRYDEENGQYNFPVEGGELVKQFGDITCYGIDFFTSIPCDEGDWYVGDCDGCDIPDWLHVNLADGEWNWDNDTPTGVVTASVTADPLPAGEKYREAVVRFEIPGTYIDYKFTQGEVPAAYQRGDVDGTGSVNIADVTALIDYLLSQDLSGIMLDNADVDSDGKVGIADATAIIDYLLYGTWDDEPVVKVFELSETEVSLEVGESRAIDILNGSGHYFAEGGAACVATNFAVNHLILTGIAAGSDKVIVADAATQATATLTVTVTAVDTIQPVTDHEWVDLGLPSGTLWATCNVGANSPEEYGDYFAWGETAPKASYDTTNYKWWVCLDNEANEIYITKYCNLSSYGAVDNKTELDSKDDAATVNWGDEWRIPTLEQLNELKSNCTWTWTTLSGVNGRLVTGPNGNTLFLPAAGSRDGTSLKGDGTFGFYWSRELDDDNPRIGMDLNFFASWGVGPGHDDRDNGYTVRAVRVEQLPFKLSETEVSLEVGESKTIDMLNGSGSYSVESGSGCVTTIVVGNQLILKGVATGSGSVIVTDAATNATAALTVTVTTAMPVFTFETTDDAEIVTATGNGMVILYVNGQQVSNPYTLARGNQDYTVTVTATAQEEGKPISKTAQSVVYVPALHSQSDGYEYVDLGLPSGTLWAKCNVGGDYPWDYGDYFAWGETEPKDAYDWSTYKWCNGSNSTLTKYCWSDDYGTVDNKLTLELEDDAAYVNWGSEWRMPLPEQTNELDMRCTKTWTTMNGVNGYLLTGPNGNTLFFPAAGYYDHYIGNNTLYGAGSLGIYWSNIVESDYSYYTSDNIYITADRFIAGLFCQRCDGIPVRAVRAPQD